jgi:group I intron endonuclease
MNRPKICGIYKIMCLDSGKVYIGKSIDIENRLNQHKYALKRGLHNNNILQNEWIKYGIKSFEFSILEPMQKDRRKLNIREQFWIKQYKSDIDGYNTLEINNNEEDIKTKFKEYRKNYYKGNPNKPYSFKPKKAKWVKIRIEVDILELFTKCALNEERTSSSLLRYLIKEYLRSKKYIK